MKFTLTVAALSIAGALLSVAAHAQTGRPSFVQMQQDDPALMHDMQMSEPQPGSYARYLMLNGVTREAALRAADSIDHPREKAPEIREASARHSPAPAASSSR